MRCEISIQESYSNGVMVKNIPEDAFTLAKNYVLDLLVEFSSVVKCEDCYCYYNDVLHKSKYKSNMTICSIDVDRLLDTEYIRTRLMHLGCIDENIIYRCDFK